MRFMKGKMGSNKNESLPVQEKVIEQPAPVVQDEAPKLEEATAQEKSVEPVQTEEKKEADSAAAVQVDETKPTPKPRKKKTDTENKQ